MKDTPKPALLSRWDVLLEGILLLLVFFVLSRTPADADMWWHLRAGKVMWEQKGILLYDVFSFTRINEPWVNAFWLADLGMYGLLQIGDFAALAASVALIGAGLALIWRGMIQGPLAIRFAIILLGVFAISPVMGPRPQLLSFLLLAILDLFLHRLRTDPPSRRHAWLLIPLFILWANLHGGYFWGILLLAAFLAGEALDRLTGASQALTWSELAALALWTAAAYAATVINPNGAALWRLPFYTVQVSIGGIHEWASPDFHRPDLHFMLWLIFLLLIGLGFSRRPVRWGDLIKFTGFAYMAFVSQRSLGPFVVVAVPVVAAALNAAWQDQWQAAWPRNQISSNTAKRNLPQSMRIILNSALLVALAATAAGRLILVSSRDRVLEGQPAAAAAWIQAHQPEGRLFNSYNWGGYLLWALPGYPVFIDGRADLYGAEIIGQWQAVIHGTDAGMEHLDNWGVNLVLIEPGWPLEGRLVSQGWTLLYRDPLSVVYGR